MTTDALSHPAVQGSMATAAQAERLDQYTLWQMLGIWALVALPMALLVWVVALAIIPYSPFHPGITYWLLIIAGMVWEFSSPWQSHTASSARSAGAPSASVGGCCPPCSSMSWCWPSLAAIWMRPWPGCFLLCSPPCTRR